MINVVLIVTSIVFAFLIALAAFYFMIYFQHPDDKWTAWMPKVLVVRPLTHLSSAIGFGPFAVSIQYLLVTT